MVVTIKEELRSSKVKLQKREFYRKSSNLAHSLTPRVSAHVDISSTVVSNGKLVDNY